MIRQAVFLSVVLFVLGCVGRPLQADDSASAHGGAPAGRPVLPMDAAAPAETGATNRPETAPADPLRGQGPQDPGEVIRALQARLARLLSNVVVEYRTVVTYPSLEPGEKAITRPKGARFTIIRATGTRRWVKKYMRLAGRTRYENRITVIEGAAQGPEWRPEVEKQIFTYTPYLDEYLALDGNGKPVRGAIYDSRPLPPPEIEIALGLRAHGQRDVLSPKALAGMALSLPDNDRAVLRTSDNTNCIHEWTYLRSQGYALWRYRRIPPAGSHVHIQAVMSQFKKVDGMIMPYSMTLTSRTIMPNKARTNESIVATVTAYRIGRADNTPGLYRIKWPVGTRLFDKRESARRAATRPASGPAGGLSGGRPAVGKARPSFRPSVRPSSRPVKNPAR